MYLFVTCVCCFLVFIYQLHKWRFRDIDRLPGPPTVPILGSVLEYGSTTVDVLHNLQRLSKQYGGLVRMWIGLVPNIIVTDVKYVEFFLSSTVHIDKSPVYDIFLSWLGYSILVRPGDEKWKFVRKLLTPAFHFKVLEKFIETFNSAGKELVKNLEGEVGKESVDIFPFANVYALDVLCQTSMGVNLNIQTEPNNEYAKALKEYGNLFTLRQYSLYKRNDYLFYFSPDNKKWKKCVNKLKDFTRKVIKDRREERKHRQSSETQDEFGIKKRPTFLDLLLEASDEKNILSDEEIRQEVDTVMFAGHDTTASAVSFAIFELAKHLDVQLKILEESMEIFGEDMDPTITYGDIQNLKYLDLVCKESLRMYPSAPTFERSAREDVAIDNIRIPKGTTLTISPFLMHRNENLFPDPEKFDPDRFLPENCKERNPFAYIPFSAGQRNCIGQKFALLEMKVILVKLVRTFEFHPVEPEHVPSMGANVILKAVNGVPIKLKRRLVR